MNPRGCGYILAGTVGNTGTFPAFSITEEVKVGKFIELIVQGILRIVGFVAQLAWIGGVIVLVIIALFVGW